MCVCKMSMQSSCLFCASLMSIGMGGSQALNYPLHCPCMKYFINIFNHDMCKIGHWFPHPYLFSIWKRIAQYIFSAWKDTLNSRKPAYLLLISFKSPLCLNQFAQIRVKMAKDSSTLVYSHTWRCWKDALKVKKMQLFFEIIFLLTDLPVPGRKGPSKTFL